jgi:hypothetical protein
MTAPTKSSGGTPGLCKLCLQVRRLQNSHIIPEFQYRPLYDEKHRFTTLSSDPETPERFIQKGIREQLLCFDCEQKLSAWENYAAKVYFGDDSKLVKKVPEGMLLGGVQYREFRLFCFR